VRLGFRLVRVHACVGVTGREDMTEFERMYRLQKEQEKSSTKKTKNSQMLIDPNFKPRRYMDPVEVFIYECSVCGETNLGSEKTVGVTRFKSLEKNNHYYITDGCKICQ